MNKSEEKQSASSVRIDNKTTIVFEQTSRSFHTKINEAHDMVRVELRMTVNNWQRIKKLL